MGLSREAPAIFKHGDIYLMITSGCTGWQVNRAEVYYARHDLPPQRHGTFCIAKLYMKSAFPESWKGLPAHVLLSDACGPAKLAPCRLGMQRVDSFDECRWLKGGGLMLSMLEIIVSGMQHCINCILITKWPRQFSLMT